MSSWMILVLHRSIRGTSALKVGVSLIVALSGPSDWAFSADEVSPVPRQDAGGGPRIDFGRDIYQVFRQACFECHGPDRQEGGLRLDQEASLSESKTITPGNSSESELIRRILLPDGDPERMPKVGDAMPGESIAAIRTWVDQGAVWPQQFTPPPHWAYVRPQPTRIQRERWPEGARNELDALVLRRLDRSGKHQSKQAKPEILVRRLFLDLIGLPPGIDEVEQFRQNPSDEAWEELVDDLLSRPQFGERWARHWLDLARYADSHGFQRDNLRDIWAYRDWVIRAMNEDMPFDQFTIEQLAGDLLPSASEAQKIATGFHRCAPTNVEAGSLPEETRFEQLVDRVNTTGTVWLGSTLECAQCHDHKYDPFSARDYYRILAYFNSTEIEADRSNPNSPSSIQFRGPTMPLTDPRLTAQREELKAELTRNRKRLSERTEKLEGSLEMWAETTRRKSASIREDRLLEVIEFRSEGIADVARILDDGSVLLPGADAPDTDCYVIVARGAGDSIGAIRLEALTHEAIPGRGPGRGDARKTNFILSEFRASVRPRMESGESGNSTPLLWKRARADFSQKNWAVENAIDGDTKTGWAIAPQFGKDHWAEFVLAESLKLDETNELVIEVDQRYGQKRCLGRLRLSTVSGNVETEPKPPAVAQAIQKPPEEWSKADREALAGFRRTHDPQINKWNGEIKKLQGRLDSLVPDTTLVMVELEKRRPSFLMKRGDYRQPGTSVEPGTPDFLHAPIDGPPNRLTLARWLVHPDNPLVARVTVNRWWAELFGRGLVATPGDFGLKGHLPRFPDVLDWLAVELVDSGWSMKHVLKQIVLSATYRQSSMATRGQWLADPNNDWLTRGARFRMDAEMIRDNALSIGGILDLRQYGPSIRPWQPAGTWNKVGGTSYKYKVSAGSEQYRRGIYVILKRGAPYPSFVNFDATARLTCSVRRSRTNTPLQALTLLNDPVYVNAAHGLATRMLEMRPASPGIVSADRMRIEAGFRLCTSRTPAQEEYSLLSELLHAQRLAFADRPSDVQRITQGLQMPGDVSPKEFAAWSSVATALLNLAETITKP